MARYPELPKFITSEEEVKQFYEYVQQWGAALINELDTRDIEVNATPSTNIYTVATVGTITRPRKGDIAYSVSTGKFKGYVSLASETSWQDLN